jgi:hypothetical protein
MRIIFWKPFFFTMFSFSQLVTLFLEDGNMAPMIWTGPWNLVRW